MTGLNDLQPTHASIWRRTVLGLATAIIVATLLLLGFVVRDTRCGDACRGPGGAWQDDGEAWQWDAQLVVMVAAACLIAAGAVSRGKWRLASWLVAGVATVGWYFVVARNASY